MPQTLKIISSMATREVLAALAAIYTQQTGVLVELTSVGGVEAARMVREGANFDIVVLASNPMQKLEDEGHLLIGTTKGVALSEIAIAIRAGLQWPDISNEQAVKDAVASNRVCFSTGPSGDHFASLLKRWELDPHRIRLVQAPSGVPVAALVARGEADLGIQQLSELLHQPGVEVIGPLPSEIQSVTTFSAGIAMHSRSGDSARALIDFLISAETETVKIDYGMRGAHRSRA